MFVKCNKICLCQLLFCFPHGKHVTVITVNCICSVQSLAGVAVVLRRLRPFDYNKKKVPEIVKTSP